MTNPTTGPANASGSNEQKKHTPDLATSTPSAPKSPPPAQAAAASGSDSSKRATPAASNTGSQSGKGPEWTTPAATIPKDDHPGSQVAKDGRAPATASPIVKEPSLAQPQTPSPTAGPKGPVVSVSTPIQSHGPAQAKSDENRKTTAPASASVAVRAGGTNPAQPVRTVSSDSPAQAAPHSSQTGPGDPRPIGPNDPVKPTRPAPVQSVHVDRPSATSAAGDANAST
jgi:hypothetical protein